MAEVYRFRSTERLLDKIFRELEQQTIYFASSEQLNDPMEGFRDIVWNGDNIVWINLFKHYIYCLHWAYMSIKIFGNQIEFEADHLPVSGRWDEPPTPQMGTLLDEIWNRISGELKLPCLAEQIATKRHEVRYSELQFYLNGIHLQSLDIIQQVYVKRGLSTEAERPRDTSNFDKLFLPDSGLFELMSQAETEHEHSSEIMFSIAYQMRAGQRLIDKYNLRNPPTDTFDKNRQLLILDFPNIYVEQLGKLLWPEWYTACFTKSYSNSSLWANYGDSHKGVCLIFETVENDHKDSLAVKHVTGWGFDSEGNTIEHWNFRPLAFHDICYSEKPSEIDFFNNIGMLPLNALNKLWYSDDVSNYSESAPHITTEKERQSWWKRHWDDYERDIIAKSKDWKHEQECRLILPALLEGSLDDRRRSVTYEFNSLKGIIFGIRTSDEDKIKIIEVIQRKCAENKRTDFNLYQAYYSPEHGDIRKYEIRLDLSDVIDTAGGNSN